MTTSQSPAGAAPPGQPRPRTEFHGCSRISDYELQGKLGEGTFGEVHKARSKKNGAIVALKKIIMHNEKDGFPITALREIKILKLLSHKNVLKLDDMAVEHSSKAVDKRKRPIMYMVTPYMDHDLSGLLDNPSIKFTEPQIKCYLLQLLEGLKYLHENHILHRDMKAANLLINNKGILQIADFGLARLYDEEVPQEGCGGGPGRRDYTSLVVTRWYRPPELLMHLKKYTTAIDLWGVGCVFAEMLYGKPILAGESDGHQLELIFDLVGTPTEETMPGWKELPGAEALSPGARSGNIAARFQKYGSTAISLLKELLRLDWKKRVNAIDALKHPYLHSAPYPARPGDIPVMEESHELDRRKFHDRKAALPPAPKGGTVGRGHLDGQAAHNGGYHQVESYGGRNGVNGGGRGPPPPPPHGAPPRRNGVPPPAGDDRRQPAWARGESSLPPRPPGPVGGYTNGYADHTRERGDRDRERDTRDRDGGGRERDRDRDRDRDRARNRGGGGATNGDANIDRYVPSYDSRREERPPRYDERDERWRDDRDRERDRRPLDYDGRGRTRSRSPVRDREWDRRERDGYRR